MKPGGGIRSAPRFFPFIPPRTLYSHGIALGVEEHHRPPMQERNIVRWSEEYPSVAAFHYGISPSVFV
jgi:hypothetical protein